MDQTLIASYLFVAFVVIACAGFFFFFTRRSLASVYREAGAPVARPEEGRAGQEEVLSALARQTAVLEKILAALERGAGPDGIKKVRPD